MIDLQAFIDLALEEEEEDTDRQTDIETAYEQGYQKGYNDGFEDGVASIIEKHKLDQLNESW